jgi:hypothetical protein
VLRWLLCINLHSQASPTERLYEQCSAASALCVRLTMVAQVYGGSLSLVFGAYLWSYSLTSASSASTCSAGVTVVSALSMELNKIRISGSRAATYTIGCALQAPNRTFCMRKHARARD